jgi:uncharacterized protein YjbI with pentapeptide repeats
MKPIERVQHLVLEALRALPQDSPLGESIRTQLRETQTDLATIRREQSTLRGAAAATRTTRAGGRLLRAALFAQRDAAGSEKALFRRSIELLFNACAEVLEVESAVQGALSSRAPLAAVLRTAESIHRHLDIHGSLRAARVVGVKAALALAGADLSGSEWTECDLSGSNLQGANLTGAKLPGVALRTATLDGAKLVRCLLTDSVVEGVDFTDCDLSDSTLKRAKLRGITGARVRAHQTSFVEADVRGAKLPGLDASHADANGAVFEGADLTGACFRSASLVGAVLRGVIARDVVFDRARLNRADIRSSSLAGATFRFADLSQAQLDQSILVGATLAYANLHRTSREGTNLANTDLRGSRSTDPSRARAEDFRRAT